MNKPYETSPLRPLAERIASLQADEQKINAELPGLRKQFIERKVESVLQVLEEQYPKLLSVMQTVKASIESDLGGAQDPGKKTAYREYSEALEELVSAGKGVPRQGAAGVKSSNWQDLLGFSNETLLVLYETGNQLYERERFTEAESIFEMLILLNGTVSDYQTAFGCVEEKLGKTQSALEAFSMAKILNPESPVPRVRAAELYIRTGRLEEATEELSALSKMTEKHPTPDFLKRDLEELRKRIATARKKG